MRCCIKIPKSFFLILLAVLSFFSCSKGGGGSNSTPTPAPTITSINVTSGPYNTYVTITGTGFSTTVANDKLYFNGKAAVVQYATSTELDTSVPLAAGTGKITLTINSQTATGPVFTYVPAEVVIPYSAVLNKIGVVNGPVAGATFYQPFGLTFDVSGNLYVAGEADDNIRKITPSGIVSTVAGNGTQGFTNGPAANASFTYPTGVAVDASGNIYVVDEGNNAIRKISTDGQVSTFAGGTKGYADGTGTAASFDRPTDLVLDANGNLFVTDLYNYRIRKITPAGVVTTFAGNSSYMSADGTGTGASFDNPGDIAIDKQGNLYVTEGDNLVRKITPQGVVTSIAGTIPLPLSSPFGMPQGIAFDASGNMYLEDSGRYQIEKMTPSGQLSVFAGTGNQNFVNGPVTSASFGFMEGIVIDPQGNIFISEGNQINEITFE